MAWAKRNNVFGILTIVSLIDKAGKVFLYTEQEGRLRRENFHHLA